MNHNIQTDAISRKQEGDQFHSIMLLINNNKYKAAENYLKIFLEGHPDNKYAIIEYAKILRKKGDNESARHYLESGLKIERNKYFILEMLFLCIEENEYEEAYKYLRMCEVALINDRIYPKIINIKVFLNHLYGKDRKPNENHYFANQLYNYNKNAAIEHIKQHKSNNDSKYKHSIFNELVGIKELLKNVSEQLNHNRRVKGTNINDMYLFHYLNIGSLDGQKTDYFAVVTIKDTYKIITMYPINIEEYYCSDVLELKVNEYTSNKELKKISQIDKFNSKYNIKN